MPNMTITPIEALQLLTAGVFAGMGMLLYIYSMIVVRVEDEERSISNVVFLAAMVFIVIFAAMIIVFTLRHIAG